MTNIAPNTIATQREDLLRQIVIDRPSQAGTNERQLFQALIGLTVHAYMADTYAAALTELDPARAEEIAQELADDLDAGALPTYAWHRAVELGHDPQDWISDFHQARTKQAAKAAAEAKPTT